MIFAWGEIDQRRNMASSVKPIYAFLTYKRSKRAGSVPGRSGRGLGAGTRRVERGGRIQGPRDHVPASAGADLRLRLEEEPGEAFAYNDYATGLLVWALFNRVYDRSPKEYDEILNGELLGAALGFEDEPTRSARACRAAASASRCGIKPASRCSITAAASGAAGDCCAKIYSRQALSPPLPDEFPRTAGAEAEHLDAVPPIGGGKDAKHHAGSLGHFWWHNDRTPDGTRLLPDAPPRTFLGVGYGGRSAMVAIPELDLVAVWNDVDPHSGAVWSPFCSIGRFKVNATLRELLAARISP